MASEYQLQDYDNVLIVEGYSDLVFYKEVLKLLGKDRSVFIKEMKGKSNLTTKLDAFITPQLLAEKTSVGVIVDADANAQGTFTSIQTVLKDLTAQDISLPGVWTAGAPKVGVFITPDANSSGELETLVWRAWAANATNAQSKTCVENYIQCMKSIGHEAHSPDKGLVSALLAIRNDEDPRPGPGARENIFDLNHPEYSQLREFLSFF